ncbi:hypothetical protein VTK56DRAFT_6100 [Thermocarpiscus australiensis]
MVFFHFGNDPSSWAMGNDCYSFEYNISGDLKAQWNQLGALFNDKAMAGTRIQWLSTSPDGSYCLCERNGTIYSNRTDLMQAIRKAVQGPPSTMNWNRYSVDHVSFSPYGAWLLRLQPSFGEGLVQVSAEGRFPDTFISMASPYLDFRHHGLQQSQVQYAFFGAHDAILIRFSNGSLAWDRVGARAAEFLETRNMGRGVFDSTTLGKNTVLCPYDNDDYFFHLVPSLKTWSQTGRETFTYWLRGDGVTADFLGAIINGRRPPPQSIPKVPIAAAKPAPMPPALGHAGVREESQDWWSSEERAAEQADDRKVPQAARDIYEKVFDEHVQKTGRNYFTDREAAAIMRAAATGLSNEILGEIWERTDVDGDGRFDREEFVQAMWLISVELAQLQDDGVVRQEPVTSTDLAGDGWESANNAINAATNFTAPRRTNSIPLNQKATRNQDPRRNQNDQSKVDEVSKQFGDMKLRESLMSSIVSEKPNVKWDDVAGLGPAKEELQEAIIFPLRFPQMFQGKRQARRAILLYGPPGTGKSYLAKAIATEVDHTLFSISSADIMSKWYGDSEGLVRQLFELAREKKPAIIFIDEIDALCGNRDGGPGGGNENTARMKTELLVQMDGVGKDNSGILLLAATNLPWSLDPAVRRRFQKRIHIPLPDVGARKQLFKIHLGDLGTNISEKDVEELARRSEGLSGNDVANAVQDGLMVPIKKVHMASHFVKVCENGSEWYTPCDKGNPFAVPMTWRKVPQSKLKEPPLTADDLFVVMKNVRPSVTEAEIERYHEWTRQFGLEGA